MQKVHFSAVIAPDLWTAFFLTYRDIYDKTLKSNGVFHLL